jgi:secondary thiamine-phosphate synthase enzyme
MKQIPVRTSRRTDFVDITSQIEDAVRELGLRDVTVTVYVPHTTAGVTINENADPDVMRDISHSLDRLVPWEGDYAHSEGNSAAHIKAGMMGSSVRVIIAEGRLCLGTGQGVFLCEFDGPRQRQVWVSQ